jgi:hypothetical protein
MKTAVDLSLVETKIEYESEDAFGRVSSCSIQVKGRLRRAMVTARKRISASGVDLTWELRTLASKLLGTGFMDSDDLDEGSEEVDCLILDENDKGQALILERVSEECSDYARIGVAELLGLDKDNDFFEKGEEKLIRLV